MEQEPSKSSLHYLFQEVSNLRLQCHENLDTIDSSLISTWLNNSKTGSLTIPNLSEGHSQQSGFMMPCQTASENVDLDEPGPERSSPWRVLSLINLQCERLMQDGGESSGRFHDSKVKSKKKDRIVESSFETCLISDHGQRSCCVPPHTPAPQDLPEGHVASSKDAYYMLDDSQMLRDAIIDSTAEESQLTSLEKVLDTACTLDYNGNFVSVNEVPFVFHLPLNTSSSPLAQEDMLTAQSRCPLLQTQENKQSASDKSTIVPSTSNNCSSEATHRTKTLRKQSNPTRSVNIHDQNVQGVFFRMDTELDDNKDRYHLLITSKYSKKLLRSARRTRRRSRTSLTLKTSSFDEGTDVTNHGTRLKVCASCCTKKTPMWRDADDGTPLCNACGIRYKKYRVRCGNCWHIPRKESNSNVCCLKCGTSVRSTSQRR